MCICVGGAGCWVMGKFGGMTEEGNGGIGNGMCRRSWVMEKVVEMAEELYFYNLSHF